VRFPAGEGPGVLLLSGLGDKAPHEPRGRASLAAAGASAPFSPGADGLDAGRASAGGAGPGRTRRFL